MPHNKCVKKSETFLFPVLVNFSLTVDTWMIFSSFEKEDK